MFRPVAIFCTFVMSMTCPVLGQDNPREAANQGTVGVIVENIDDLSLRAANELAYVLNDENQLRVLPTQSRGAEESIIDLLFLKGVEVGIVQTDVLDNAKEQQVFPGLERTLHYIAKLYSEEIHLIARRDVDNVWALSGRTVNIGPQ